MIVNASIVDTIINGHPVYLVRDRGINVNKKKKKRNPQQAYKEKESNLVFDEWVFRRSPFLESEFLVVIPIDLLAVRLVDLLGSVACIGLLRQEKKQTRYSHSRIESVSAGARLGAKWKVRNAYEKKISTITIRVIAIKRNRTTIIERKKIIEEVERRLIITITTRRGGKKMYNDNNKNVNKERDGRRV